MPHDHHDSFLEWSSSSRIICKIQSVQCWTYETTTVNETVHKQNDSELVLVLERVLKAM